VSTPRTYCGTPRAGDAGTRVTAYGWVDRRRDHGGLIFIDLRDYTGTLQVVIDPNDAPEAHRAAREARLEWVLRFEGELRLRAPENVNPKRETGDVELRASACTVLAIAKTPPFPVNEDTEVDEQLRLTSISVACICSATCEPARNSVPNCAGRWGRSGFSRSRRR
jgi:aspartyl-tRNA synthetase